MELACSGDSVGYKEEGMELGDRELRVSVFREAEIVAICFGWLGYVRINVVVVGCDGRVLFGFVGTWKRRECTRKRERTSGVRRQEGECGLRERRVNCGRRRELWKKGWWRSAGVTVRG